MIITVFTNGSLIADEHLELFGEYPPHEIEVSVYGTTDATYERVTGVPRSFTAVRRNLDRILERRIPLGIKTMILRDNWHEISDLDALARSLGVTFRLDPLVTPRLDGDPAPLEQRVDPESAVQIEMAVEAYQASMAKSYGEWLSSPGEGTASSGRLYRCGAGQASFHIDPQGIMHPCLMSPIGYDAAAAGFADAWRRVKRAVDGAFWDGEGGCAGCPDMALCRVLSRAVCPGGMHPFQSAGVPLPTGAK